MLRLPFVPFNSNIEQQRTLNLSISGHSILKKKVRSLLWGLFQFIPREVEMVLSKVVQASPAE